MRPPMFSNLFLAIVSAWVAFSLWPAAGVGWGLAVGFAALSLWQFYCAATARRRTVSPIVREVLGG